MKRLIALLLVGAALLGRVALGEPSGLSVSASGEEIRPGKAVVISFSLPRAGTYSLKLLDEEENVQAVIAGERQGSEGYNALYWNGTDGGVAAPQGEWRLVLETDAGETAETAVRIGRMAPVLLYAGLSGDRIPEGEEVILSFYASERGTLMLREEGESDPLLWENVERGSGEAAFEAVMSLGEHSLILTLTDQEGFVSDPVPLTLLVTGKAELPADRENQVVQAEKSEDRAETQPVSLPEGTVFTPVYGSPREGQDTELNYWTLEMDVTEEERVWQVLTAPMTVLDSGKKNAERTQVVIRKAPGEDSEGIGVATCLTQGVHVLERGEEWSLVECYSSSFHDSPVLNWNALIQGYVPTAYLKEVVPNQEMGLVVDKLTQRLYVFVEGKLFSTLLISTGLANARQPYNETRSGEFLLVSKVGEFSSDNLRCALAIRFNDGDLLHEVPYIATSGGRNYSGTEAKLGTKASHGCIRVQRQLTPEGVNMAWIWNHYKKNTKILVWEDWQGRQIPMPAEDAVVYYNPKGGKYYHLRDHCSSAKNRVFEPLEYGLLTEDPYSKLKACEYCAAPPRPEMIEAINETYVAGGDHDPVMTEALKTCPRPLKKGK